MESQESSADRLPAKWVGRIFDKLTVKYGLRFLNQWPGVDMSLVHASWADELSGFGAAPHAITYALEHLNPDQPPNVLQFRKLCNMAPAPDTVRLPDPRAPMPPKVAQAIDGITDSWVQRKETNPAQYCIDRIMTIVERRGGRMSTAQRQMIEACERVA